MGRRSSLRMLGAALVAALSGCLSPTLPLPPPDVPDTISPQTSGAWRIAGTCLPGALVVVLNERTGQGAVVEDRDRDGRYEVEIAADVCDLAWVSQSIGEEETARTTFVVQERTPSGPVDPLACK